MAELLLTLHEAIPHVSVSASLLLVVCLGASLSSLLASLGYLAFSVLLFWVTGIIP